MVSMDKNLDFRTGSGLNTGTLGHHSGKVHKDTFSPGYLGGETGPVPSKSQHQSHENGNAQDNEDHSIQTDVIGSMFSNEEHCKGKAGSLGLYRDK